MQSTSEYSSTLWLLSLQVFGGIDAKLMRVEMMREDLKPVIGHDHDYCVVGHVDHNYCERCPWDHDYCVGALMPNNNNIEEKVPWDHNYSLE